MATREGRSTRAARKRKTLSDEFTTQYSRKSSKKKGAVQIPDETIAHEQVTPGADPTTNKPNHSSKIGPSATKTEVCETKAEQSASLVIKQDEEPSNISDIGNELGLTLDHHEDLLAPKSEIEIDPNDLYSELFSYVTTREQNTGKETYSSDTHSLQNCMSEDGNKPDTVHSETSSALSQHIKAEPTVHEELMNQNEGHESDSKNEEAQEGTDDGAPSDHAQTPEPSLSSPDNIDEGQLSHTPSKPKMRPWTVYEEERLLIKLNELLSVEKNQTPQIRLLRRQLHVRKVKRSQGLPVFDISSYLYKAEHEHLPCEHKSPSRLRLQCRDVIPSVGLSAPVVSSSDNLTTQQKILDRFQMPYPAEQTSYFVPFTRRLHGGNYQLRNTRSPYTSRILKAFIWRDYETKPTKLKLLDEIRSHSPDVDGGNPNAVCESIDYRYVSAEHIPVINRICHQAFWPTIDLSECLQYSDFSCVAMYKKLIIGFAFMVPDVRHDETYISFIYTHPEWRGAGIASIMMYHLIQTCMGKDVTLHVSMTNPALNLYLKFGFKIVEVIHNFYEKYHPADSSQSPHAFYMRLDRG